MGELDRGTIIVRLEPVEESVRGKKRILYLYAADTVIFPIIIGMIFYYLGFSEFFTIVFPIILFFMEIVADLVVQYGFSRSMGPINIYSAGIEPPQAWIHKLLRKQPFFDKERISTLQSYLPGRDFSVGPCIILYMKDKKGWTVSFGVRRKEEVERFFEFAAKDWVVNVERFLKTPGR
jgi:hypothetical protein